MPGPKPTPPAPKTRGLPPSPGRSSGKPAPSPAPSLSYVGAASPSKPAPKAERKLFGTDGVRGAAGEHPMTSEMALRLGKAVAFVAKRGKTRPVRVVIGKDTRLSGYMFETALASGICSMGGRVMLCGPVPTPAVAFLTQSMRADAGLVISASHNPYEDNGIKIFGPDGFKLPDADEAEIERLLEGAVLDDSVALSSAIGSAVKIEDARGRYVVFAKRTFPDRFSLDGMRVVVDAAHGAAYRVAPSVFEELGADVTAIGVKPNGRNINRECGALHPEHVRREVLKRQAAVGIALDGDADRLILVDERGQVVDGDAILALCAARMLRRGSLPHATVVATIMSNLGLERALDALGGKLVRTAVGDRYVVEAMRKGGYAFGGEQSGHLVFLEHATTGDGVIAALQVLAAMLEEGKPLSELAASAMQRVPQVLENATFAARKPLEQMRHTAATIRKVERALGANGRVVVRWSGTEAKLRAMVEGEDERAIAQFAKDILSSARKDLGEAPPSARS